MCAFAILPPGILAEDSEALKKRGSNDREEATASVRGSDSASSREAATQAAVQRPKNDRRAEAQKRAGNFENIRRSAENQKTGDGEGGR